VDCDESGAEVLEEGEWVWCSVGVLRLWRCCDGNIKVVGCKESAMGGDEGGEEAGDVGRVERAERM